MGDDEITICSYHQDKQQTPLIWTFAFNYKEYWCPGCGATYGMMGAGENVKWTWRLHHRYLKYLKASRLFLRARAATICARLRYKGKMVKFSELPEALKKYYHRKARDWKYKFT